MLKEKVLTTTGFYGTGSSAVTDLIREYQNVCCQDDYEVRFLYDPDCISDLEYNLIENPNRHNTGHAIKRFIKQMNMLDHVWCFPRYSKYFNGIFNEAMNDFYCDIKLCSYQSAWHYDVYERGKFFYVISRIYSNINIQLHKLIGIPLDGRGLVPKSEMSYIATCDEKTFLEAVKSLTGKIIHSKNEKNKEFVLLDQLVPPSNISRYSRYVDNLKVIVVDRDPRDIYILEKELWRGTIVPTKNVEIFCKWYKWTRQLYYKDSRPSNCINLQFEDLIYNYEETVDKIENFFGLKSEDHINKLKFLNPEISKKNTKMWEVYGGYENDLKYIESELSEYCYNFSENLKIERNKSDRLF